MHSEQSIRVPDRAETAPRDVPSQRIAQAEEGLAEMQRVLDQAKRAVDAADRAERAAHDAADHARSLAKITLAVAAAAVALVVWTTRRAFADPRGPGRIGGEG